MSQIEGLFQKKETVKEYPQPNLKPIIREVKSIVNKIPQPPSEISVDNLDEVKLHLRTELAVLAKKMGKIFSSKQYPKNVEVINFPSTVEISKFPELLGNVKVENLDEITSVINKLHSVISKIDFQPDINVAAPNVTVNPNVDFDELIEALRPLQLMSNKATSPITVQLSDGENFVKALERASENLVTTISGGVGFTQEEFQTTYRLAEDRLASYRAADVDDDASPNYFGFINPQGRWYILRETLSTGADTYRYSAGQTGYAANWTNRVGLDYDYISEVKF